MKEANSLKPFDLDGIKINYQGYPTLSDGKLKCVWNNKMAMSKCVVCNAKPSQIGDPDFDFDSAVDEDCLQFGLCNLHVRLKAFEWFCKVGMYRDIKSYTATGKQNKAKKEKRKKQLIKDMKKLLKLDVYQTQAGQIGNTNSGKTSR